MIKKDNKVSSSSTNKILSERLNQDFLQRFWKKNNPKLNNIPVGVTNFVDLVTKHRQFYVEKSTFIKHVLDLMNTGMKMILITRPSGWGKSINLSMLKYFLNRQVDKNGLLLNPQPYKNIFQGGFFNIKDGRNLKQIELKPLLIADGKNYSHTSIIRKIQGTCPVIYMDFSYINCTNLVQLKKGILNVISLSYESHSYLKNTAKSGTYHNYRKQITRISQLSTQLFMKQPLDSFIKGLDSILQDYHKQDNNQSFILIDGCDSPIYKILKKNGNLLQARAGAEIIASILTPVLNSTKHLKIVAMGRMNIFETCLKGYKHFGIWQHRFYQQFGFNQSEVHTNLIKPIIQKSNTDPKRITQYLLKKITKNYGGYTCTPYTPQKIEPYATVKYLHIIMLNNQLLSCQFKKQQLQDNWYLQHFISFSGFLTIFGYQSFDKHKNVLKQMQPQYPMQLYVSANNQNILNSQLNNIVFHLGFITGSQDHVGKWKILQPRFPNNLIANAIGCGIINLFGELFGFDDFSSIDLTSSKDICSKFKRMLNSFYRKQTQINNLFLSGAFYYRYRYSSSKQFMTAYQLIQSGKNDMIDNVYIPLENFQQLIILHFHYVDVHEPKQDFLHQIIYQTVESSQLERALKAGKLLGNQIQQYVLRLILVMPDTNMSQLQVNHITDQIIFTPRQIENIVQNMSNEKVKEEWSKMRRLGTLKKGIQSKNIFNILSSQKMNQNAILEELIDLEAHKKQRRFDLNGIKGPLSRNIRPKKLQKPSQ